MLFSLNELKLNISTLILLVVVILLIYKYYSSSVLFEGFNARLRSYGYPYYWPYHLNNSSELYRNRYDYKYRNLVAGDVLVLE